MSRHKYPRLGSVTEPQKALCSCCSYPAVNRIDIQGDHMRGNDEVMQVCDAHLVMARSGDWKLLYRDFKAERLRRPAFHSGQGKGDD